MSARLKGVSGNSQFSLDTDAEAHLLLVMIMIPS